jgi:ubiquinone/menaquinone biosynthesis C-methylase UbiE
VSGGRPCPVCPAEHAGWLVTPGRRLFTDPRRILRGLLEPGDTALDLGCGPGFFTLPLAQMVGSGGRVIAVDVQSEMLRRMTERARRKGLTDRITAHKAAADSIGLGDAEADFALAFWMVHEVPDVARFLAEVHAALKPAARLLVVEPRGHVGAGAFAQTTESARAAGFTPSAGPRVFYSRSVLLTKP